MKNIARACALVMIGALVVAVPLSFAEEANDDEKSKRTGVKALNRTLDTRAVEDKADDRDPGLGIEKRGFQPTKGSDDARLTGIDGKGANDDAVDPLSQEFVVICHKPGTPAEHTLIVPRPALDAHLRHGDEEGACPGDESPTGNEPA